MRRSGHYDNTSTSGPLLSLSELWGSESSGHNRKSSNIEQRLEEEVYRRQHCERLVQELQRQLLEEREKLAVAMRVDESKDYAISQLQTAWEKLVGHWNDLEDERNELAQQLQDHKITAAQEVTELQEKVKSVERELSRALELAQGYQTRCSEMECELVKAKSSTEATVALSEAKMLNLNNEIASITAERDQLLKRVSDVETAITKDRSLLKEAEAEMKKMQDTMSNQEAEIHSLKQQSETLLLRLNEAKSKNQLLENSKTAVQKALEETKKKEKERQSELKEVVEQMKQEKLKLRDSYQQQVETLVREKVQEFQSQLDAAETALEQREKTLAEMTSQQIKLLTEKYQMEVKLLEEKQQDEMKLYKIQLAQANQQLAKLQAQLQLQTKHRNELLEQLHDAMEAQWQEALRMVQGKGDAWTTSHFIDVDSPSQRKSPSTKDHPVSVPETTAIDKYQFAKMLDTVKNATAFQEAYHSDIPPLTLPTSSAASTVDDEPFSKEDQLTYRVQENKQHSVSPGEELRKYIQQLLDRSPGNPIQEVAQESAERDIDKEMEHPVSSVPVWEPVGTDQASISSVASTSQLGMISRDVYDTVKGTRNMKSNKPPWK
ncbi:centrobin isoform X4 [Schistocerca gregaria]|nr:centrobin isoform X4 [Schistocerca gregaria]